MDYRYTAIVLKKREVGETDRLYTFYTREAGKIQAIAKGVRKAEAKLASALETLSSVDLMVVRSRGMGKVAGAVLENSFASWRNNFDTLALATETAATFDSLVDLEEKDEQLFDLLLTYLETGERLLSSVRMGKIALITEALYFQVLIHLGYQLELGSSVVSGRKPKSGERILLSPSAGGLLLDDEAIDLGDGVVVSENLVKTLRLFATQPLAKLDRLAVPQRELTAITHFRKIFLHWIRG